MSVLEQVKSAPMSRVQARAVALCLVINLVVGFDLLATSFLGPTIAREWGLSPSQVGILLSSGLAGMAIGALFLAPLADRIGRRRLTLGCLALASLGWPRPWRRTSRLGQVAVYFLLAAIALALFSVALGAGRRAGGGCARGAPAQRLGVGHQRHRPGPLPGRGAGDGARTGGRGEQARCRAGAVAGRVSAAGGMDSGSMFLIFAGPAVVGAAQQCSSPASRFTVSPREVRRRPPARPGSPRKRRRSRDIPGQECENVTCCNVRSIQEVKVSGVSEDAGRSSVLVLLHGGGPGVDAASNWSTVRSRLSSEFRCLAPDLLEFGTQIAGGGPRALRGPAA